MANISTTKSEYAMLEAHIEHYDSEQRILSLCLYASDISLMSVEGPSAIVDLINALYAQPTIDMLRELLDLETINSGRTFPMFPGGEETEITEDYVLTRVRPDAYVPATVEDPETLCPFRLRRIVLTYTWVDAMPSGFPAKPAGWRNGGPLPNPPYPSGTHQAWPLPAWAGGSDFQYFSHDETNGLPSPHIRYGIAPQWAMLLANNPDSDPEGPWYQYVYDCFVPASPGDSFWHAEWPYWLVSKGINNDWVATSVELTMRNFGYTRFNHWLSLAQPGYVGQEQRLPNYWLYYYADCHPLPNPCDCEPHTPRKEYSYGIPGIFLPYIIRPHGTTGGGLPKHSPGFSWGGKLAVEVAVENPSWIAIRYPWDWSGKLDGSWGLSHGYRLLA